MKEQKIAAMVEGGKASAGPPLGPALGPMGVNIGEVIAKINEQTKAFSGMKIPITLYVNPQTKAFRIEVGSPPLTELLKKELNVPKFIAHQKNEKMNVPIGAIAKVAKMKQDSLNSKNFKDAFKIIVGSCVSYGIIIDGRDPRDIQKDVDEGKINPETIDTKGPFKTENIVLKKVEEVAPAEGEAAAEGEAKPADAKAKAEKGEAKPAAKPADAKAKAEKPKEEKKK